MILCGNFCDRHNSRIVTYDEGLELANQIGCPFFETSPLSNINISESFGCLKNMITKNENPAVTSHRSTKTKDFCRI